MEQIDYKTVKEIEGRVGSPFYLMFPDRYRHNLSSFLNAFRKRYPKVIAGYSFKTNYVPALCEVAKREGAYAEVVSQMELELALRLGFKEIIFNGPIKRLESLQNAIEHQAIINIDAEYEVDTICDLKANHPALDLRVGMRVNVELRDDKGDSTIQCGLRQGRFGFPHDILARNIFRLRNAGISICSLHGHTSSSDRAVLNYKIITDYMLQVCEEFELNDLEFFNIGGGFFGAAPQGMDLTGRPSYQDYADIVLGQALSNGWFLKQQPTIVIEPGSSVVSNVFEYYTKVYQLKQIGDKHFVVVDGSVFDVKPTMHNGNIPHSVLSADVHDDEMVCDVVGSTCMEKDIILRDVRVPHPAAGDFIQLRGVGAYTLSLTPSFINYLSPIVSVENGQFNLVRRRQNIDDILSVYMI